MNATNQLWQGPVGFSLPNSHIDKELKDIDASMGQYQRNVGNYGEAFAQLGGLDIASLATVPGAIVAVGTAAIEATQYVLELTREFTKLRGEVQTLTNATGDELDSFTARVASIAETFGQGNDEILNAANSVSKQLGISFDEAFTRIEEGFIAGSDQTGQFLDSLREYPAFFKEAGLDADAFFNIINQQATEGIFNDKGVDVVKEVTLRLRELPKATEEALTAIGLQSTEIRTQIEQEGIGAAIATVSKRIGELEADSPEVGQALADIFGSPGEDVGVEFVTSLQNINEETGTLIDLSNEYQVQQQRALEVNREFAEVQNEVARELGGAGAEFDNLGTIIETKALKFLLFFIDQIKLLGSIFGPLVDAFVPLLKSLGLFNEEAGTAENIARLLAKGFEIVTTPVKLAVEVIAKFVQGLTDAVDSGRRFLEWVGIVSPQTEKLDGNIKGMAGSMGRFGGSVKRVTKDQADQNKETDKTINKFKSLKKSTDAAAVAADKFAKGSIGALKKEISDLKKELEGAAPSDAQGVLEKLVDAEAALKKVEDFRTELRNKLTSARRDFAPLENLLNADQLVEEGLGDQVRDIGVKQGEAYADGFEETSSKIEERNKARADKLLEDQRALAEGIRDIQGELFQGIGDVLSNVGEASQIKADNEIKGLEERYGREIELAEGNTARQEQLREELATATLRVETKEFEDQKKFRRAAALTAAAEGVINIISAPSTIPDPFGAIYKGVRLAFLTATTSQQIANINAQTIGEKGLLIQSMANGGILRGETHAGPNGGIPISANGKRAIVEHGEAFDTDEFGGVAIINKRSSAAKAPELAKVRGISFPGKRQYLSDINSYRNYGVSFAAEGAVLQPEVASVLSGRSGGTSVLSGSLTISEDSIGAIASQTAYAVRQGSEAGISAGLNQANKRAQRESRLSRRTGI